MPWDFTSDTEKAWRAYEPLSSDLKGQPQLQPTNGPGTGTVNWY